MESWRALCPGAGRTGRTPGGQPRTTSWPSPPSPARTAQSGSSDRSTSVVPGGLYQGFLNKGFVFEENLNLKNLNIPKHLRTADFLRGQGGLEGLGKHIFCIFYSKEFLKIHISSTYRKYSSLFVYTCYIYSPFLNFLPYPYALYSVHSQYTE